MKTLKFSILLFSPFCLLSQHREITLSDCIRFAKEQGPAIISAKNNLVAKRHSYNAFMADFYPHFSFEGDAPGYNRSINAIVQDDGSIQYKPQSQASSSASLTITQQLPWTGGEISLLSGISRIDLINSKSSYYRSSPLSLRYRQPIFQLNTMKWNITSEDLRIQIAEREYEEALEDIAIDITNKFFDAYTARMNVENASFNLSINDTLYQITQGRFNVGKVAENDLLQSELAVMNARTQLANASLQFERAIENLRFAIGFSDEKELSLVPPSTIPIVEVTQELALEQARQNRSDVVNYELLSMNAERSVEQAEYNNSFNALLTANAGFNQRSSNMQEAYQNLMDQQQLSLSFEVPIYQWGRGSFAVEAVLADQRRILKNIEIYQKNFELEIAYQVKRLKLLEQHVMISAKADTIAQRRFDVSKDRYLIGKIDVTNLFIAQNEKDSARRNRIQTLLDYWAAYYRLRRLTLFDFEAGKPLRRTAEVNQ